MLALDKTNHDLILKEGGGIERVSNGRQAVQEVKCKLQTILGEWVMDTNIGYLSLSDFEKGKDIYDLEDRARVIIVNTKYVNSVIEITAKYDRDRMLNINFKADTVFGYINVDVPWNIL